MKNLEAPMGRRSRTTQERRDDAAILFTKIISETQDNSADTLDPLGKAAIENLAKGVPMILLLPNSAQKKLLQREIDLRPQLADTADRMKILGQMIDDMLERYRDGRFTFHNETMWKEDYGKIQMVRWAEEVIQHDPRPESLQKLAWLSFDANGLKAINDLSGSHENGTTYLRMLAGIFFDEPLRKELCATHELTDLLVTSGGGDEFSVALRSKKPFTDASLQAIVDLYEAKIESVGESVAELIDFEKEDTKIRFFGYTEEDFYDDTRVSPDERARLLATIPSGFRMRASGQGGGATLAQGLTVSSQAQVDSKRISVGDRPRAAFRKIMGGAIDQSDAVASRRKKLFKNNLKNAARPDGSEKTDIERQHDLCYSDVLARTTEVRVLLRQLDDIDQALVAYGEGGASCDASIKKIGEIRSKSAA